MSEKIFGVSQQLKRGSTNYEVAGRAYRPISVGERVYAEKNGTRIYFRIEKIEERRKFVDQLYTMHGGLLFLEPESAETLEFANGDELWA